MGRVLILALVSLAACASVKARQDNQIYDSNRICTETAKNPHKYLVPDPEDCTNYYSCQNLGGHRGFKAHLMNCPAGTAFDLELRNCNFIDAVPRCTSNIAEPSISTPIESTSKTTKAIETTTRTTKAIETTTKTTKAAIEATTKTTKTDKERCGEECCFWGRNFMLCLRLNVLFCKDQYPSIL